MKPLLRRVSCLLPVLFGLAAAGLSPAHLIAQEKVSSASSATHDSLKAPRAEDKDGAIVPFQYEPPVRPFLTVQARINNSEVLTFMLDTGSEFGLLVCPWVEKQSGLKPTGNAFLVQPGRAKGHYVEGGKVNFVTQPGSQNVSIDMPVVGVVDLPLLHDYVGSHVAGIMGMYYFRRYVTRFDFEKKSLTIFQLHAAEMKAAENSILLPLVHGDVGNVPTVEVGISSKTTDYFIVDTGSNSSVLPDDLARNLSVAVTGVHQRFTDLRGAHRSTALLARQVLLGKIPVILVPFVSVEDTASRVLGLDFLSRFRVTMDLGHDQLLLEPRKNFPLVCEGYPGMYIMSRNGKIMVDKVIDPAVARAGIEAGDQILAVDGLNISDMPAHQIYNMIGGYAQTWMELRIQKPDSSEATARVLRRSPYPGVISSGLGVFVKREKDKSWHVLYVLPGSAADGAGISAGDTMMRLNGKPVTEMDLETIEEVLSNTGTRPSLLQEMVLLRAAGGTEVTLPKK